MSETEKAKPNTGEREGQLVGRYLDLQFKVPNQETGPCFNVDWKITFTISKAASADCLSFNTAEISIYNTTAQTVSLLSQRGITVRLDAGYEALHGVIFSGVVNNVTTTKRGADIVTTFYCTSDTFEYSKPIEKTVQNVSVTDLIKNLCDGIGASYKIFVNRKDVVKSSYSGTFSKVLAMICADFGIVYSLDNGFLSFTDRNITTEQAAKLTKMTFTPETGMIGNPQVTETGVTFRNLITPKLMVNDIFSLYAKYAEYNLKDLTRTPNKVLGGELNAFAFLDTQNYNGNYMALALKFNGDTRGNAWFIEVQGSRIWNKREYGSTK